MQAESTNPMIESGLRPLACKGEGPRGWWWWDSHSTPKNIRRWAYSHNALTSPGLPHLEWTERGKFGGLRVVLDHSPVWMGGGRWGWCIKYYFLHTKIQITNQILTVCPRKRRSRFFELFESGAGRKDGCSFSEGFEQRGGGIKKLVSCRGRKWSAEGKTVMATDDRRASVGG